MKWLFSILLLLNLGLFLLIYPQQSPDKHKPSLADVGELKLASEISQAKPPLVEPDTAAELTVEHDVTENLSQGRDEQVDSAPEVEVPLTDSTLPADAGAPLVAVPEALDLPASETSEVSIRCAMVGYVDTRSAADQISVRLRALGFKPELQSETLNIQAGYWVLIPQQASRRDAIKIVKRLENSGVSDLWRFTSGELVHAISLGLFRDQARAADRKREIDALGFESVIQPRHRQKTNYWLSFSSDTSPEIKEKDWARLVKDFPELLFKEVECQ
jgi:hypothetical protein